MSNDKTTTPEEARRLRLREAARKVFIQYKITGKKKERRK